MNDKALIALGPLIGAMIRFFRDRRRIEHSLKVFAYAQGIGGEEGVTGAAMQTLCAAALLHDIGIPSAKERYGSSAGAHQESEGERLAPELLERAAVERDLWDRIIWLIGHHHQEKLAADDSLLQILMEADFLVNLVEGNLPRREPRTVCDDFFRTASGKRYMNAIFDL